MPDVATHRAPSATGPAPAPPPPGDPRVGRAARRRHRGRHGDAVPVPVDGHHVHHSGVGLSTRRRSSRTTPRSTPTASCSRDCRSCGCAQHPAARRGGHGVPARHRVDGGLRVQPPGVPWPRRRLRPVPGDDDDPDPGAGRAAVHRDEDARPERHLPRRSAADDRLGVRGLPAAAGDQPCRANSTRPRRSTAPVTCASSPGSCCRTSGRRSPRSRSSPSWAAGTASCGRWSSCARRSS